MKIKKFMYEKEPGNAKSRELLVQKETDTYLEGLDLQDLDPEDLALLEADLAILEESVRIAYKELIGRYDLNMFKRFLKNKIVETIS